MSSQLPGIASLPMSNFKAHRANFVDQMKPNSIAFVSAASEVTRSNDTEYAFCQNKKFYYLTGFNEPDALLLLIKTDDNQQSILFSLPKDENHEVWHGRRIGQTKARELYNFDQSFVLEELASLVPAYLSNRSHVYFCFDNNKMQKQVFNWLTLVSATIRQGSKVPEVLIDATPIINELRLVKSDNEIALMRQINYISGLAHKRAMQQTSVGKFEYQIEAELLHEFSRHGARHPAYASIVAGGDNANILHYTNNSDMLKNDELLLIDAGGELSGYAADITRTFPINGKFTKPQKLLYQLVLDTQLAVISSIKPGITFVKLNEIANKCLTQGLLDLGILSGDLTQLLKDNACKKYFIHGLGHWLGLDVHDVGDYQINDNREQCRQFVAGMVLTIEPGLYMPNNDYTLDEQWRGIGIRIEDNIVVTEQGHENLTINSPRTIIEIETLMNTNKSEA
jgi:Xaa-Pro aminopeptidase